MTSLNREQMSLLLLLRDDTLTYKTYLEAPKIGRRFSPPLPYDVVKAGLEHLIDAQFAETDGRDRYRVTHLGSEVARITLQHEGDHKLRPEMVLPRSAWSIADDEPPPRTPVKRSIDWTKWGTVVGGLALVATIVIAILT